VADLRLRLQQVKSGLHTIAASGSVQDGAREQLLEAIQSIQNVSEEMSDVCEQQLGEPVDCSLQDSRAIESQSEVESGEFDMHG